MDHHDDDNNDRDGQVVHSQNAVCTFTHIVSCPCDNTNTNHRIVVVLRIDETDHDSNCHSNSTNDTTNKVAWP